MKLEILVKVAAISAVYILYITFLATQQLGTVIMDVWIYRNVCNKSTNGYQILLNPLHCVTKLIFKIYNQSLKK